MVYGLGHVQPMDTCTEAQVSHRMCPGLAAPQEPQEMCCAAGKLLGLRWHPSVCVWQGSLPCSHMGIGLSSLGRLHSLEELIHKQREATFLGLCLCHCILGLGGNEPVVGSEPGMGSDGNFCILWCPHFAEASGTCRRTLSQPLILRTGL